jgi:hypothetical protein
MTNVLHNTLIAPVAVPRHRKPDPVPCGPVARFVDNHVLPHVRGGFYGLGIAIVALAGWAIFLDAFGPRPAVAFALEIIAVWCAGVVVGTRLCERIDAASSTSSARHRKVA